MGPGDASGWYWTENTGSSRCARPSTEPSFRLTSATSPARRRLGSESVSTTNPWFCDVIET